MEDIDVMKREALGQFFTPEWVVDAMLGLKMNEGSCLEPSAGDGAFFNKIPGCRGIEIDNRFVPPGCEHGDFFDIPLKEGFDTVIGNPPYIQGKAITPYQKAQISKHTLIQKSANIFVFFIEKAFYHLNDDGGELIFIVPREFLTSTSASGLRESMWKAGRFTHIMDFQSLKVFKECNPEVIAFRYVKGFRPDDEQGETRPVEYAKVKKHNELILFQELEMQISHGIFFLVGKREDFDHVPASRPYEAPVDTRGSGPIRLSEIATVAVGAASGFDEIYHSDSDGNVDFVCSWTFKTRELRRMIYPHVDGFKHTDYPVLSANKEVLLNRRIKRFAQWNWWHWGRPINPRLGEPRVYVNAKIRAKNPFFLSESDYWDASILAVFPLREGINMEKFTMDLNMVDWESMGLRSGTRLMLSQRVLSNVILPENFRRYLP